MFARIDPVAELANCARSPLGDGNAWTQNSGKYLEAGKTANLYNNAGPVVISERATG